MEDSSSSSPDSVTRFGTIDYVVFVCMLAVSASIGFYYACSGSRQRTAGEFLMANRSMGVVPIALSLLASFLSAIGLLGIPVEIYTYGTSYWSMVLAYIIVMPMSAYIYLPVFYSLNLTSAYEYLERRFNRAVRQCGSIIFMIQMILYMAMVTYAPALALSQVTGLHVWTSVAAIGVVCIFYTTVGGMKAVMWTDAFQIMVMIAAMLAVDIRGLTTLGGFQGILEKAQRGMRINQIDFSPDPFVRHTFWCLLIGGTFTWLAIYGVNQTQVQRYLTSPSMKSAQMALWLNLPGLFISISICCFTGLILYANYADCDPKSAGAIKAPDQLLPLYVMERLGEFPGLPGFFVAGIFSGSLSTLSSGLNSLAAVTLEDFLRTTCCKNITEERAGLVSKFLALAFGIIAIALVAVVEQLGNILQAAVSIFGIIGGPLMGLFTLGMFFPWANSWGALSGLFTSLSLVLWIGIGTQVHQPPLPKLEVSTTGCNITDLFTNVTNIENHEILSVYRISYQWYSTIGCITLIVVGLIVSFITGSQKSEDLDPRLLCPPVRALIKALPPNIKNMFRCNLKQADPPRAVPTFTNGDTKNGQTNLAFDNTNDRYNNNKNKTEEITSRF